MKTLADINSKEELQKLLAIQKAITETAVQEVITFYARPEIFVRNAATVLEKYARYATLTEFKSMPSLADSEKWGATFGVTAIIGTLILEQTKQILRVQSDLRLEYMRFLADLDERKPGSIEMNAMYRLFAVLSDSYGIIWTQGDAISLTVVGRRVYLHLLDAMKYIDEVTAVTAEIMKKP